MKDQEALIGRVEGASGPDRELDELIAADLAGAVREWQPALGRAAYYHKSGSPWMRVHVPEPGYTASLDAAKSLLPPKWKLRQANYSAPCADDRKWHLNLHGGSEGQDTFVGRGATMELATVAAALRARLRTDPAS
jgi:hypothetical protein